MLVEHEGRFVAALARDYQSVAMLDQWFYGLRHRGVPVPPPLEEFVLDSQRALRMSASGQSLAPTHTSPAPSKLMSTRRAAAIAGTSERTMRRRCVDGRQHGAVRIGRAWLIPLNDIEVA